MTIKMRLDTEGLRALIANNPELEVQIGKEVMDNIKRDTVPLKVDELVQKILWSMVENKGNYYAPDYVIKDERLKRAVGQAIEAFVTVGISERVDRLVSDALASRVKRIRVELQEELVKAMREMLTPQMAQELMKEKLFG